MPSIVELAYLCESAYDDTGDRNVVLCRQRGPGGTGVCRVDDPTVTWKRKLAWSNAVGFYAAVFECDDRRVLAYRGTDDLWDGLVDDAFVATGGVPPQVVAALVAVPRSGASGITLTGHSLGGALALIAGAHLDLPVVTFNAPGVMDSCLASAPIGGPRRFFDVVARCAMAARSRNIRIEGDPVSSFFTTGFQTGGRAAALPAPQCGLNARCRHSMRTCITQVIGDARNYDEVGF